MALLDTSAADHTAAGDPGPSGGGVASPAVHRPGPATTECRFAAMGSQAHVVVVHAGGVDPDGEATGRRLLLLARDRVAELEHRWTRFQPDSELMRLNAAAGRPVVVSPDLYTVVERAVAGWRLTGGRFDPTMLAALQAAGYDRDHRLLARPGRAPRPVPGAGLPAPAPAAGCAAIGLDPALRAVTLPAGTALDLGGIGKGCAADLVVADLLAAGATGACVNLGGDLRVSGQAPTEDGWVVSVENPHSPGTEIARLALADGGVATSTHTRRHWRSPSSGGLVHHLLDPASGTSAWSGAAAVTVLAATGWEAEVLSKAAYLAGPGGGPPLLAAAGASGLVVDDDGGLHVAAGMEDYLL